MLYELILPRATPLCGRAEREEEEEKITGRDWGRHRRCGWMGMREIEGRERIL